MNIITIPCNLILVNVNVTRGSFVTVFCGVTRLPLRLFLVTKAVPLS